jgi:TRAP-type C4-dicarboxylate transport system permease small subunit
MRTSPETVEQKQKPFRRGEKWLIYLGSTALLFAMVVDAIAVLGRHIGLPPSGSIELIQAAILVASSTAILSATLAKKHAKVRILVDRLEGSFRIWLQRVQAVFCALFFGALTVGSIWIFLDLQGGFEESEVLHIPYAPLRIVCIISVLGVVLNFLRRFKESPPS